MFIGVGPQLQQMQRANEMMGAGRYAEAGPIYFEMSKHAYSQGDLMTTKLTAVVAAKAYVLGNQPDAGANVAKQLIDRLVADGKQVEVVGIAKKVIELLRDHDFAAQADDVSNECARVLGKTWHDPNAVKLPKFCANCGAAVKPADVVHPTPTSAACNFCGAVLA